MKRINTYSYIRTLACISIIFLHILTNGISRYSDSISSQEFIAYRSIADCLKWGVPCFVMVTGMLLLDPERNITYKKLFGKYVARILKALVIFGAIFALLEFIAAKDIQTFLNGLYDIFAGTSWSHMWYLYCLIGLYLLLPFYRMITERAKQSDIKYLLIVCLIFLSGVPLLKAFGIQCGFYIHIYTIYTFWFFLGYYLKNWGFKRQTGFYLGLLLAGTALLVLFTILRWTCNIDAMDKLFDYSSILVILQTTGVIGLIQKLKLQEHSLGERILCGIDRHSFGIYLIHMIVIWFAFMQLDWNPFLYGGFTGVLLLAVISFFFALVVDAILRKLPVFRSIL